MKKIVCIVQARMSSTRLPGKVLLKLGDRTVLGQVLNQLSFSKRINECVIATSTSNEDNVIEKWAINNNIKYFRGDLEDVLKRFYLTAKNFGANIVVRITADCPLIDPEVVDAVVGLYISKIADYASNADPPTFPDGLDTEVFSFKVLQNANKNAKLRSEREHVTPYIRNNPLLFKSVNLQSNVNYAHLRWTLDNPEDYDLIKKIYTYLEKKKSFIHWRDVLNLFHKNPQLRSMNRHIKRNEGYDKSLREDKIL